MGVVRREGDWRLHKRDEGVYEITHSERVEMKIITSDYTPDSFQDERTDFTVPVREVDSFSDAESLFQDVSKDGPPQAQSDFSPAFDTGGIDMSMPEANEDGEFPDIPPIGILVISVVAGGLFLSQSGLAVSSPVFMFGAGLLIIGVAIIGLTYWKFSSEGAGAAAEFLLSTGENDSSTVSQNQNDTQKTPPAPENLKNELYFERADRQCEWCDTEVDSPDVHHITPREDGGPNEPENLIVLCPNCHRKADRGVISRSKLRYAISED
jgi:hypothetical protein